MTNHKFNQKGKKIFSENVSEIIESLLRKYKLETIKKLFESFGSVKSAEEKKEFQKRWINLPGPKIAQILREIDQGKIKTGGLASVLQERLALPKKTAESLAKDLKEKILNQKGLEEEKEIPIISPKKPDIYREPIE